MVKKLRTIDYRYYICIAITLIFLVMSLLFTRSFYRIVESFKDLGLSMYYYFTEIFMIPRNFEPTINDIGGFDMLNPIMNIVSFDNFKSYFELSFNSIINSETIIRYLSSLIGFLNTAFRILLIIMPLIIVLYLLYRRYYKENDNQDDADSKPLTIFKAFELKLYKPLKNWLLGFMYFAKEKRVFKIIWLLIWLFYFNVFTIIIEVLAYYFYFVMSFDMLGIFKQLYKLLLDLMPLFRFVPLPIWIVLAVLLFNIIRKNIAYKYLNHFENKNRGYINTTGQVTMICAPMGKGKTTILTDMALSQEVMFRDKSFEKILENDLKFPNFPFINLETELKRAIEHHEVYNLATAKAWILKKKKRCSIKLNVDIVDINYDDDIILYQDKFFNYDWKKYGYLYYDGLKTITIFEMLESYVQLYFIYIIESSLLISNYGIREDNILHDLGYFPMWHSDFFKTNNEYIKAYSRHAHILDMDMLRLGKKIVKDNYKSNALEFGIIVITEGGKERGNMLDTKEMKKNVDETNQKNDMFNKWLKMCRHSATVDNFPFIKVIIDEQRPESMGADVRELCEKIIFIDDKSELKTPLMFFKLETMVNDFISYHFTSAYYKYRFVRGDNTLFMYLFKNIYARYYHYYMRLKNTFGYYVNDLQSEKGTLDENFDKDKYYIMTKKIYAKRFATDCFSDYFATKAITSPVGLNDLEEFKTERATIEELQSENSYFINDLMKKDKE